MTDFRAVAKFSDKVVLKDEYGDTVSFEVDEGVDSDYDNQFYMVVHEGDTNNVIEWRYTREQLTALIQFLVEHTVPDASLDKNGDPVETNRSVWTDEFSTFSEVLDRVEDQITKLENRFAAMTPPYSKTRSEDGEIRRQDLGFVFMEILAVINPAIVGTDWWVEFSQEAAKIYTSDGELDNADDIIDRIVSEINHWLPENYRVSSADPDEPAIVTPPNNFPARVSELGTDPDKFAELFEETFTTNPVSRIDKEALSSWFEMAINNGRKEAKKS